MSNPVLIPAVLSDVQAELRRLRALLQLEQKEDHAQFKLKNVHATIKERRRRGLTWYPVNIIQEEIGFGGKVMLELERPAHRQELHLFQVGSNASLFSGSSGPLSSEPMALSGVVTRVRRNRLLLATTQEALPDWVQSGGPFGIDLTFDEVSYREMNQAIDEVMGVRPPIPPWIFLQKSWPSEVST